MTSLVDTSVLVDLLRGREEAAATLIRARADGPVHASEITRAEVLAGARPHERSATQALLATLTWHAVDRDIAERAAELAREWRPSRSGIDLADYFIAATCLALGARPLTRNVKHFPMFDGLTAPY